MSNSYLSHTDREEGWIHGFQNPMEYKNDYRKLMLLFDLCIICFIGSVYPVFNSIFRLTVSFNYTLKDSIKPLSCSFPTVVISVKDIVIINTNDLITLKLHNEFSDDIPT